jgi:hypothetical protein
MNTFWIHNLNILFIYDFLNMIWKKLSEFHFYMYK